MEIKTKAYGIVEIDPQDIITFENGLVGFEELHEFVLLGNPEVNESLVWLQCLENENAAFVTIQPRHFRADYQPVIHAQELADLKVENESDVLIYAIVVVPEDISKMTANLKAPIIINVKNNKAKQIILNDESYHVKELILGEK